MAQWQLKHGEIIVDFLSFLNAQEEDFVLKGGTALSQCYGLTRFSEDIDLDGTKRTLGDIVKDFCSTKGYKFRVAKDTETVQRYMIDYGGSYKPLKVEVSYRKKIIRDSEVTTIGGIKVYDIDSLCLMKSLAYAGRDRIRDLYDLAFIINTFYDDLAKGTIFSVQNSLAEKGIEQFDYLVETQSDELIDKDKLASDFLDMHGKLGLLVDGEIESIQTS